MCFFAEIDVDFQFISITGTEGDYVGICIVITRGSLQNSAFELAVGFIITDITTEGLHNLHVYSDSY